MKEIKFKIKGMDCQACARLIEGELRELPGVEKVRVNFDTSEAVVTYNEQITGKDKIYKLVRELKNYKVQEE